MSTTPPPPSAASAATQGLSSEVRKAFKDFCSLDDDIKRYGVTMRQARNLLKSNKKIILDWMTSAGVHKVGRNTAGGANIFTRVEKDVYIRPTQEQQRAKMEDLLHKGVTDPMEMIKQLRGCAGTRKETRLYRRKPRKPKSKTKTKKTPDEEPPARKRKTVTFSEDA